MLLDYIDKGKDFPNQIDMYIAQNIVMIAESLKIREIEKKFITEIIVPSLNRENVIFFIRMSFNKLSTLRQDNPFEQEIFKDLEVQTEQEIAQQEELWFDFFSYTLDIAAANVQYILKFRYQELMDVLSPSVIEEIIERSIRFYKADILYDNSLLFDALIKIRNCTSIFELLEQERVKIEQGEQSQVRSQGGVKPTLTWKIQNLSGNFYRESDPFMVEGVQWKLSISYFRMEEQSLTVSIKMVTNPFEVKKSKDYFKKKEFFLASNIGMQNQVNPMEELEDENDEEFQKRKKMLEQANAEFPSHCFITIVSSVRIDSNKELSDPTVHTLICSSKSPAILQKYQNFYIESYGGELTVEIYFKTKYIYSSLLLYISRNFTHLITDKQIGSLPKEQFKLLLKHKLLNVTQEDEVVKALCLWVVNQEQEYNFNLENDIKELLENVNWNYVTLTCFLDLTRNFPLIRRNPHFKKIITKEFNMRAKYNAETTNLDPPRFSYKFNKTQQLKSSQLVNKKDKNQKGLLYINHENFQSNLIEALLEPIDMINPQISLCAGGLTENSHRKYLELQFQMKQRELLMIEEQLRNMREAQRINDNQEDLNDNDRSRIIEKNNMSNNYGENNLSNSPDEVETVKNSMKNLRVGDLNYQQSLKQVSEDAMKKMYDRSQFNDSPYNVYDYSQVYQKDNKIQILFESHESEHQMENQQDDEEQKYQGKADEEEEEEKSYDEKNKLQVQQKNYSSKANQQLEHYYNDNFSKRENSNLDSYAHHENEVVVVIENKGIQTSLQMLLEDPPSPIKLNKDQSVQMTIVDKIDFEVQANNSMNIDQNLEDSRLQKEDKDIQADSEEISRINIQQEKDQQHQQQQPLELHDSSNSMQLSPIQNNEEAFKQGEQQKLSEDQVSQTFQAEEYQKQMNDYTQKVEFLAKDIFDSSFLEQFLGQNIENKGSKNMSGIGGATQSTQIYTPSQLNKTGQIINLFSFHNTNSSGGYSFNATTIKPMKVFQSPNSSIIEQQQLLNNLSSNQSQIYNQQQNQQQNQFQQQQQHSRKQQQQQEQQQQQQRAKSVNKNANQVREQLIYQKRVNNHQYMMTNTKQQQSSQQQNNMNKIVNQQQVQTRNNKDRINMRSKDNSSTPKLEESTTGGINSSCGGLNQKSQQNMNNNKQISKAQNANKTINNSLQNNNRIQNSRKNVKSVAIINQKSNLANDILSPNNQNFQQFNNVGVGGSVQIKNHIKEEEMQEGFEYEIAELASYNILDQLKANIYNNSQLIGNTNNQQVNQYYQTQNTQKEKQQMNEVSQQQDQKPKIISKDKKHYYPAIVQNEYNNKNEIKGKNYQNNLQMKFDTIQENQYESTDQIKIPQLGSIIKLNIQNENDEDLNLLDNSYRQMIERGEEGNFQSGVDPTSSKEQFKNQQKVIKNQNNNRN